MWNYNWHQEIKRIIRDYYKKVYDNKMDNQEELDGFLERHNLLRLTQEEIENITLEYYLALKINGLLTHATWMYLHRIMLSEKIKNPLSKVDILYDFT